MAAGNIRPSGPSPCSSRACSATARWRRPRTSATSDMFRPNRLEAAMRETPEIAALKPRQSPDRPIDPGVTIGHIHLKVADIDRALAFYCGVLGFELMQRYGTQAAFISAGGYHHHIGL